MCGIAGLWRFGGAPDTQLHDEARRMSETLRHRGPDDDGTWADAAAGVAFGFRRLAILDLSPTGHQPMSSADGRFHAVFNGEVYNHAELRDELRAVGATFRGTSDTEVVVEAAARWGVDRTIDRIAGMYAIAIWDARAKQLWLVRDRLGKKPLYVGQGPGWLLFASELKALCAHPAFTRRLDQRALAGFVQFGYVPDPLAIYQGVTKIEPGCRALVDTAGALSIRRYWDAVDVALQARRDPFTGSEQEALDALDAVLRRAVATRMIADVPLGAFLSGGIDSSVVVSLMQAQSTRPVRTFTIGFPVEGFNEAEAAADVARHLGTDHTELYVSPEQAQAVVPDLPALFDEPFADSSQIPTFLVSRMARDHVTVALSGDGGDEVFGGYTRYLWAESIWAGLAPWPVPVRRFAGRTMAAVPPAWFDAGYRALAPLTPVRWRQSHPGDKLHKLAATMAAEDPDRLYRRLVSQWKSPADVMTARPPAVPFPPAHVAPAHAAFTFVERMMVTDLVTYLPGDILVKVDRASMGTSLEARAPLLDHEVVTFGWRLPLALKRRAGAGKWLLRQLLARYVPAALIERPKMGFGIPIGAWLRGPLRDWAEALLAEDRLRREGLFDPAVVRGAWRAHLSGARSDEYRLWVILMYQAWADRWRPVP